MQKEGHFQLTRVPAGSYLLQTFTPAFVGPSSRDWRRPGTAINLNDGETIEGIDISLRRGGAITGLGVNISNDAALIRYPTVWSEIIIASALGITFYFVVSLVERLIMPWHVSFREEVD